MAKKNSMKRALIFGATSMALSVSMFVGTTFAWFTDSVASNNNIIKSGNLDVELYYQKQDETGWTKVTSSTNVFKNALWEPGHTEVVKLKVANEGSLALKYQLGVNIASEVGSVNVKGDSFKLSDFIQYGIVEGANAYDTRTEAINAVSSVATELNVAYNSGTTALPSGEDDFVTMVVYMPTTVGNEANHAKGEDTPQIDLGINLYATQVEAEDDSFDDDYDKDAWHEDFEVETASDLQAALNNGVKNFVLKNDIVATETIVIPAPTVATMSTRATSATVIDLNGKKISITDKNVIRNDGATVVLKNGTIDRAGTAVGYAVNNASGALTLDNVTVKKGVYSSGSLLELNNANVSHEQSSRHAIYASNCAVSINGGTYHNYNAGNATIMAAGTSVVTINGGTFGIENGKATHGWTSCMLDSTDTAKFVLNNGTYNGGFRVQGGTTMTINGGSFNDVHGSGYSVYTGGAVVIYGGVFTDAASKNFADKYIAPGYQAVDNGDGTFRVVIELENGNQLTPVANYSHLFTDGTNYYVYDAIGLISMNRLWAANPYSNNMWNKSYNVMADIDATGYTWNNVFVVVGNNANDGFVFDGHGNTITGLNINGGLFSGTPNGGNAGTKPGVVKDITFDGVNVNGDHFAAVLWNATYGDLLVENVNVINSTIVGNCNVAALVGGTSQESGDVTVEFKNCNVSNNTIVANGKAGQDPNGAAAYISRAFDKAFVKFTGNNVSQNNQITNKNGLVGGGIYGYTTYVSGIGFMGTGSCDTFTDWNGISAVSMNVNASASKEENGTALAEAINASSGNTYLVLPTGEYKMPSVGGNKEITIVGTKDTVIDNTKGSYMDNSKVSFEGVTIKGSTGMSGSDYAALYSPNVTYTNCTFDGPFRIGRDGAKFINCTFTNLGNDYVWTYGNDVEFIGCTFETAGKAILIYNDGGSEVSKVTVKDCVFKATQGAKASAIANQNCAAIEIQNYGNGVNLVTSNNQMSDNFSGEWRIKSYHSNQPAIIVNGITYTQIAVDGKLMTIDANRNVTVQG